MYFVLTASHSQDSSSNVDNTLHAAAQTLHGGGGFVASLSVWLCCLVCCRPIRRVGHAMIIA
jgi:hypothetical protein